VATEQDRKLKWKLIKKKREREEEKKRKLKRHWQCYFH